MDKECMMSRIEGVLKLFTNSEEELEYAIRYLYKYYEQFGIKETYKLCLISYLNDDTFKILDAEKYKSFSKEELNNEIESIGNFLATCDRTFLLSLKDKINTILYDNDSKMFSKILDIIKTINADKHEWNL